MEQPKKEGVRKKGSENRTNLEISVWYDRKAQHIHIIESGTAGFHTTVCRDPKSNRGHPHLFDKLADCLRKSGAIAPKIRPKSRGPQNPPRRKSRSVWTVGQAGAPGLGKRR